MPLPKNDYNASWFDEPIHRTREEIDAAFGKERLEALFKRLADRAGIKIRKDIPDEYNREPEGPDE
jgi:hypothetical protein